jgi:hypothetical protein
MHVVDGQLGRRKNTVGLGQKVIHFLAAGSCARRIAVVADVRRPDEEQPIPWQDEERPAVGFRFDVEGVPRRTFERAHDDVAALCATDEFGHSLSGPVEHRVHPRPGSVDNHPRYKLALLPG